MARIDIAIPNYQYGRYLEKCVSSVLTQSVTDIRVLIIDNASTDDSVEIAQRFVKHDSRVEFVRHSRNLGFVQSANEGIDWAKSKYFMTLCSDDVLASGALARALGVMDYNSEIAFCNGSYKNFTDDQQIDLLQEDAANGWPWRVYSGHQFIRARCLCPLISSANFLVIRTEVQKQAGYLRTTLPLTNDLEMILRLSLLGSFAETRCFQGFRREHGKNLSSEYWGNRLAWLKANSAAFESFFSNEGKNIPEASYLRSLVRNKLGSQAYWAGIARLALGKWGAAGDLLRFAVSQSPRCAVVPPASALLSKRLFNRVNFALREAAASRVGTEGKDLQIRQ